MILDVAILGQVAHPLPGREADGSYHCRFALVMAFLVAAW